MHHCICIKPLETMIMDFIKIVHSDNFWKQKNIYDFYKTSMVFSFRQPTYTLHMYMTFPYFSLTLKDIES